MVVLFRFNSYAKILFFSETIKSFYVLKITSLLVTKILLFCKQFFFVLSLTSWVYQPTRTVSGAYPKVWRNSGMFIHKFTYIFRLLMYSCGLFLAILLLAYSLFYISFCFVMVYAVIATYCDRIDRKSEWLKEFITWRLLTLVLGYKIKSDLAFNY